MSKNQSEAELKRRIHETANSNMSDIERMMGGAIRVSLSSVDNILVEVAKEFPMTEQQIRILTDGPIYESDIGSAVIADPQKVAKWFKKYFLGEQK